MSTTPDNIDPDAIRAGQERAEREMRGQPERQPSVPEPPRLPTASTPDWFSRYGPNPLGEGRRKVRERAHERGLRGIQLDNWLEAPNADLSGLTPDDCIKAGNVERVLAIVPVVDNFR